MAEGRGCVHECISAEVDKYFASKMSWKHQKSNVFCLQFIGEFVLDVRYLGFLQSVNLLSDVHRPIKHQQVYSELGKICLQFLVQKHMDLIDNKNKTISEDFTSVCTCFFQSIILLKCFKSILQSYLFLFDHIYFTEYQSRLSHLVLCRLPSVSVNNLKIYKEKSKRLSSNCSAVSLLAKLAMQLAVKL